MAHQPVAVGALGAGAQVQPLRGWWGGVIRADAELATGAQLLADVRGLARL